MKFEQLDQNFDVFCALKIYLLNGLLKLRKLFGEFFQTQIKPKRFMYEQNCL
jgi:hypothetical protein